MPSQAWKTPKKSPVTQVTSLTGQGLDASEAHLFPLTIRGGASHGTLVPLHLPLLGFFFIFVVVVVVVVLCVCVCVCVLYYKFILYITRGAPNKAVKKKIPRGFRQHVIENRWGWHRCKYKSQCGHNRYVVVQLVVVVSQQKFVSCFWVAEFSEVRCDSNNMH